MRRWFAILSLLLAALWVPVASHCLLEHAGWIHHSHACLDHDSGAGHDHETDEDDSHGHDAADGGCHLTQPGVNISKRAHAPVDLAWMPAVPALLDAGCDPDPGGISITGSFARDFSTRWQFVLRTALSPRAPSC